jgi:hypothetical protein
MSVHSLSTVVDGVKIDQNPYDGNVFVSESVFKQDDLRSQNVTNLGGAKIDGMFIDHSRCHVVRPGNELIDSQAFDSDVGGGEFSDLKEYSLDIHGTVDVGPKATDAREIVGEGKFSRCVADNQSEVGTVAEDSPMSFGGANVANMSVAAQVPESKPSNVHPFAMLASDSAPCESESMPKEVSMDQDSGACLSSCEQRIACEDLVSETRHLREAAEEVTELVGPSSGEIEYLPPWLRDQDNGQQGQPTGACLSVGRDVFNQELGSSEALSPSNGFSSCCAPWLKEEWNLQVSLPYYCFAV